MTTAEQPRRSRGARSKSAKIQRLVDLIAALLSHHAPITFEQIMEEVPAYQGKSDAARKRMFERDKRDLRLFGVPLQTVGEEGSDESAYRLPTKEFYLPYLEVALPRGTSAPRRVDRYGYRALTKLTFEPDELSAVAQGAARVRALGDPALVADTDSAMRKLAFDLPMGAVSAPDDTRIVAPAAKAEPGVLEALSGALLARKRATFDYHSMGTDTRARREVEPYGLFFLNGHWYLAARDIAKDALRNFRVARITGVEVNAAREETPDYEIPRAFRLREHARSRQAWELGDGAATEAIVEFRRESGAVLAAAALGAEVPGDPRRRAFLVRRSDAFARWLLSFVGEAVPIAPPSLVEEYRALAALTLALYEPNGARP